MIMVRLISLVSVSSRVDRRATPRFSPAPFQARGDGGFRVDVTRYAGRMITQWWADLPNDY